MKKNLLASFFVAVSLAGFAQPATDFTTDDCDAVTHNFFNELNTGKVIVLNWVMPCSSCTTASVNLSTIVAGYAASNPGQVLQYLIDDNGGISCATLNNWVNTNGVSPHAVFRNTGSAINEANYGGSGMPHITVVGPDHNIYFNGLNSAANNPTAITNAINQALLATGINENIPASVFSVSHNQSTDELLVRYNSASMNCNLEIINTLGQTAYNAELRQMPSENQTIKISTAKFHNGIYFVQMTDGTKISSLKFVVSK